MRYSLVDGSRIEALDGGWVAYSPLSGETLVLNTEAAAVLELVASGVAHESEVAAALAGDAGIDAAAIIEALRHVWDQLSSAGLIESATESEHNPG